MELMSNSATWNPMFLFVNYVSDLCRFFVEHFVEHLLQERLSNLSNIYRIYRISVEHVEYLSNLCWFVVDSLSNLSNILQIVVEYIECVYLSDICRNQPVLWTDTPLIFHAMRLRIFVEFHSYTNMAHTNMAHILWTYANYMVQTHICVIP